MFIQAENLTMFYGSFQALYGVSFSVKENEVLGLLGPNGAGKTTIMRILTTFYSPASGRAIIGNYDIIKNPLEARKIIGYLPEEVPVYQDMRVDEYIDFVGRARGLSGSKLKDRKEWVIESCGLRSVWKHDTVQLSLGFRQRVGLAQALIHDPEVIILDEPTSGLDPLQIIGVRTLIKNLSKEKTIIFSTHILQEASAISDELVIINRGNIIASGTMDNLKNTVKNEKSFIITVLADRDDIQKALEGFNFITKVSYLGEYMKGSRFAFEVPSYESAPLEISNLIKEKGWQTVEFTLKEPALEDIFINLLSKGT